MLVIAPTTFDLSQYNISVYTDDFMSCWMHILYIIKGV